MVVKQPRDLLDFSNKTFFTFWSGVEFRKVPYSLQKRIKHYRPQKVKLLKRALVVENWKEGRRKQEKRYKRAVIKQEQETSGSKQREEIRKKNREIMAKLINELNTQQI